MINGEVYLAKEREGQESFTIEESFKKGLVSEELKNVLGGIK